MSNYFSIIEFKHHIVFKKFDEFDEDCLRFENLKLALLYSLGVEIQDNNLIKIYKLYLTTLKLNNKIINTNSMYIKEKEIEIIDNISTLSNKKVIENKNNINNYYSDYVDNYNNKCNEIFDYYNFKCNYDAFVFIYNIVKDKFFNIDNIKEDFFNSLINKSNIDCNTKDNNNLSFNNYKLNMFKLIPNSTNNLLYSDTYTQLKNICNTSITDNSSSNIDKECFVKNIELDSIYNCDI